MKINIKCLIPIDEDKIKVIKLIRGAFDIGLKDAKELSDKFSQTDTIVFDAQTKVSIRTLNQAHTSSGGAKLLEYSRHGGSAGFCREDFLEKVRFFAGLALDNGEPRLAEDLLHVYNKHDERLD